MDLPDDELEKLKADLRNPDSGEGVRLFPYLDTKHNITIGCGHNLSARGIPGSVVELLLNLDLVNAKGDLDRWLVWWRGCDNARQRVLLELCFNMGIGNSQHGLLSFKKTLPLIQVGRKDDAATNLAASQWARDVQPARLARILALLRS